MLTPAESGGPVPAPAEAGGRRQNFAPWAVGDFPVRRQKTGKDRICSRRPNCQNIAFSAWFRANSLSAKQGNNSAKQAANFVKEGNIREIIDATRVFACRSQSEYSNYDVDNQGPIC
jgi:hypothetical protein